MKRVEPMAALLLVVTNAAPAWALHDLGRLLTTPDERRLIEAARLGTPHRQGSALVVFQGAAQAEDGRLVVWADGHRLVGASQLARHGLQMRRLSDGGVRLLVADRQGRWHLLAPGQAFDRESGRVLESWQWPEAAPGPSAPGKGEDTGVPPS